MRYAACYRQWLHGQPAAKKGDYEALGAWLMLSVHCSDHELGEGDPADPKVPVGNARVADGDASTGIHRIRPRRRERPLTEAEHDAIDTVLARCIQHGHRLCRSCRRRWTGSLLDHDRERCIIWALRRLYGSTVAGMLADHASRASWGDGR